MANGRLDVHFVVSVLAEHIARQRRRLRGDVVAKAPMSHVPRERSRELREGGPEADTPRW